MAIYTFFFAYNNCLPQLTLKQTHKDIKVQQETAMLLEFSQVKKRQKEQQPPMTGRNAKF